MSEVADVVSVVMPYLSSAALAYGGAVVGRVVDQVEDTTADAAVGLGRRLLRRLFASGRAAQVREAVAEVAGQPADESAVELLRVQVQRALAADGALLEDVVALLRAGGAVPAGFQVTVTGGQGVQVGHHNSQTNTFSAPPQ